MSYQLNRRSFILASGLTAIASTRVLGANDTLRVGVIGAGGRMGTLLNAADHFGHYQIVPLATFTGATRRHQLRSNALQPPTWIIAKSAASDRCRHHRLARPLACAHGGRRPGSWQRRLS